MKKKVLFLLVMSLLSCVSMFGQSAHEVNDSAVNKVKEDSLYTTIELKGVEVTVHASKVRVKGDSLVYNAAAYRVPEGSTLEALENQLSPHFVFNNFSILADLIEVDPKRASAYLMNLSKVYRYTLSHLDHETVTLQEELAFLDRYLALLQQRFGEGIQVRIADEVAKTQGKLPPAALQMLIENAIKHNEHTKERPLVIDVTAEGQHISVSNRKQPITNIF